MALINVKVTMTVTVECFVEVDATPDSALSTIREEAIKQSKQDLCRVLDHEGVGEPRHIECLVTT